MNEKVHYVANAMWWQYCKDCCKWRYVVIGKRLCPICGDILRKQGKLGLRFNEIIRYNLILD